MLAVLSEVNCRLQLKIFQSSGGMMLMLSIDIKKQTVLALRRLAKDSRDTGVELGDERLWDY